MKCIALGFIKNDAKVQWVVPNSFLSGFFDNQIRSSQKKLVEYCDALSENSGKYTEEFGYYLTVFKSYSGSCMVVTDEALDRKQMFYLTSWVLHSERSLEEIASTIENYTQSDFKLVQIKEAQEEVIDTLHQVVEKLTEREGELKQVQEKAAELEALSSSFVKETKKLNSCLPDCTLF